MHVLNGSERNPQEISFDTTFPIEIKSILLDSNVLGKDIILEIGSSYLTSLNSRYDEKTGKIILSTIWNISLIVLTREGSFQRRMNGLVIKFGMVCGHGMVIDQIPSTEVILPSVDSFKSDSYVDFSALLPSEIFEIVFENIGVSDESQEAKILMLQVPFLVLSLQQLMTYNILFIFRITSIKRSCKGQYFLK